MPLSNWFSLESKCTKHLMSPFLSFLLKIFEMYFISRNAFFKWIKIWIISLFDLFFSTVNFTRTIYLHALGKEAKPYVIIYLLRPNTETISRENNVAFNNYLSISLCRPISTSHEKLQGWRHMECFDAVILPTCFASNLTERRFEY